MENPEKSDEFFDKIEIFSSDDDKLKFLGELLSNESSRKILLLLTTHEMSANDLSEKTNLRLSLVIHHLNKMQQAGIVKIVKTEKNTKNHDVKYYSAKSGIMILPQIASKKAKTSKTFQNSLKRIMRFSSIAIAGIASWLVTQASVTGYARPTMPPYGDSFQIQIFWPITITLAVVIIGLIVERILVSVKK